jgi:hypothetical protein
MIIAMTDDIHHIRIGQVLTSLEPPMSPERIQQVAIHHIIISSF